MMRILVFFLCVILSLCSIASKASDNVIHDSIKISNAINDFYNWYLTAIKENKINVFQPKFAPDKNGMTTIDYSEYTENLSKYHFSDSLLMRDKRSYNDCINSLSKVKFSDFGKTVFVDLDEYENSNCDFSNYFRWIGGQEPIDGIKIIEIKIVKNRAKVKFENYNSDPIKNENYYWGENSISLIKVDDQWNINEVESWFQLVH